MGRYRSGAWPLLVAALGLWGAVGWIILLTRPACPGSRTSTAALPPLKTQNVPAQKSASLTLLNGRSLFKWFERDDKRKTALVVYLYGVGDRAARGQQCMSNFQFFLSRGGVEASEDVDVLILILRGSPRPQKLLAEVQRHPNVEVLTIDDVGSDLCAYRRVLDSKVVPAAYEAVLFLNCGARGPYYESASSVPLSYAHTFRRMLSDDVCLVGPVGSCEDVQHIQTFCFALSASALTAALDMVWAPMCQSPAVKQPNHVRRWRAIVKQGEQGLAEFLSTERKCGMASRNHQVMQQACHQRGARKNPVRHAQHLSQQIFIKLGGTVLRLIPWATKHAAKQADAQTGFRFEPHEFK